MDYEKIISAIGDFFAALWTGIVIIWNYICIFFKFIGQAIYDWYKEIEPSLPPISKFLGMKKLSLTLLVIVLIYIIVINIYAYHLYSKDKKSAKKNKERISEFRLLKVALLGGAFGSFLGMRLKHHKTLKKKFTVTVTVSLIIQALLYSSLIGFFGFWVYLS